MKSAKSMATFSNRIINCATSAIFLVCIARNAGASPTRVMLIMADSVESDLSTSIAREIPESADFQIVPLSASIHLPTTNSSIAAPRTSTADLARIIAVVRETSTPDATHRSIVAFDADSSAVLFAAGLPDVNGEVFRSSVVDALTRAVKRLQSQRQPATTICLAGVRNVDLPLANAGLVEEASDLLQQSLFGSGDLQLLDRADLQWVNARNQYSGTQPVMSASIRISLDVAQCAPLGGSATGQVTLTATVFDAAGVKLGTAQSDGTVDAAMTAALTAKLLPIIHAQQPSSAAASMENQAATGREAGQFLVAAKKSATADDDASAFRDVSAAVALSPQGVAPLKLLADVAIHRAIRGFDHNANEGMVTTFALSDATICSRAFAEVSRASVILEKAERRFGSVPRLDNAREMLRRFIGGVLSRDLYENQHQFIHPDEQGRSICKSLKLSDVEQAQLDQIIENYRFASERIELPAAHDACESQQDFDRYSRLLLAVLGDECHLFCRTQAQYVQFACAEISKWSPLAAKYGPSDSQREYSKTLEVIGEAPSIWCGFHHNWLNAWCDPCFSKTTADEAVQWEQVADLLERDHASSRLYVNLRSWARSIEHPIVETPPPLPTTHLATAQPTREATKIHKHPLAADTTPLTPVYRDPIAVVDTHVGKDNLFCINLPVIAGKIAYVAALDAGEGEGGAKICLFRTPIDASSAAKPLSTLSGVPADFIENAKSDGNGFFRDPRFLGSEHFIVSSYDGLIFILSLKGTAQRMIDSKKELPAGEVMAATDLGNTVYLALRGQRTGAFLVTYDLPTQKITTLVSSNRQAAASPFDHLEPMSIPFMVADPPRHRIVFFAYHSAWPEEKKGLWEYNQQSNQFRRLLPTTYSRIENQGGYDIVGSPVIDDKFILLTGETLVYDLAGDKPVEMDAAPSELAAFCKQQEEPAVYETWWHRYGNPGGSGVGRGDGTIRRRQGSIHAFDDLWQGAYAPFSIDLDSDRLLVADWSGLWVVTPEK